MVRTARFGIARVRGYSLLELMIALAISVLLLAGVTTMFTSSRSTYEVNDRLSQVQENGRFAIESIARDIRGAGYLGCSRTATLHNNLNAPAFPTGDFGTPLGGYEYQSAATWAPLGATSDASSPLDGSDIINIRAPSNSGRFLHFSTPMLAGIDDLDTDDFATGPGAFQKDQIVMIGTCTDRSIFQISNYTATTGMIEHKKNVAGQTPGNSTDDLGKAYSGSVPTIGLRSVVYYIATSNTPAKGPSLWRRVNSAVAEELAEGIEQLQFLYGIDTDADRTADSYVKADSVTDWNAVMSVSIALLARSVEEYGDTKDTRSYTLLDTSFTAPGDRRLRKAFTSTVALRNTGL